MVYAYNVDYDRHKYELDIDALKENVTAISNNTVVAGADLDQVVDDLTEGLQELTARQFSSPDEMKAALFSMVDDLFAEMMGDNTDDAEEEEATSLENAVNDTNVMEAPENITATVTDVGSVVPTELVDQFFYRVQLQYSFHSAVFGGVLAIVSGVLSASLSCRDASEYDGMQRIWAPF